MCQQRLSSTIYGGCQEIKKLLCYQTVSGETTEAERGAIYERIAAELAEELAGSWGLYPDIVFDYTMQPEYPQEPVQLTRGVLVLAGLFLGFILGSGMLSNQSIGNLLDGYQRK